jgi:cell wall-active antibiotic response 4TMS protein YvqF/putative adhesin
MSAPNPVPPPYYHRPRSIFGPLVLITLGVFFLLRTSNVIPGEKLHYWFANYWPVLLILWGVAKLIEHLWARHRGEPTPRMGAGAIVFLVFFIMMAGGFSATKDWDWSRISGDWNFNNDFDFFTSHYDFNDNFDQPLAGGTQIKVMCNRGDVSVTASKDNQAHAIVHKNVSSGSQQEANRMNDATHPKFTQQGSVWVLDLTGGDFDHERVNLELQLPGAVPLSLATRRGNLSVTDRDGNVELYTEHGDASVERVKGDASLQVRSGSVTARNVSGGVQINGILRDGTISDVGGALDFDVRMFTGDVQLSRLAKPFHVKSLTFDLQSAKLDGDLSLRHGDVRGNALVGPLRLSTRFAEVRLDDISGDVTIENKSSVVELHAKEPLGNMDITNVNSGIELELPHDASFTLDAENKDGNIEVSDFPLTVDNDRRNASARGTVGKGGPEIHLRTTRGTIQVRKK